MLTNAHINLYPRMTTARKMTMMPIMIDKHGMRAGIGIVICNQQQQLLLARRKGSRNAWQFPQGGLQAAESPEQAMWRELHEELGLTAHHTRLIYSIPNWLNYYIPRHLQRSGSQPLCIGQRQKWFLLQLTADSSYINLNAHHPAEFDQWQWTDTDSPSKRVISFKRALYKQVIKIFKPYINTCAQ